MKTCHTGPVKRLVDVLGKHFAGDEHHTLLSGLLMTLDSLIRDVQETVWSRASKLVGGRWGYNDASTLISEYDLTGVTQAVFAGQ